MTAFLAHLEVIGALLVFSGVVASMFLGSPASKVKTGGWVLGEVDEKKQARHNLLTYVAPSLSGCGALLYVVAAYFRL